MKRQKKKQKRPIIGEVAVCNLAEAGAITLWDKRVHGWCVAWTRFIRSLI